MLATISDFIHMVLTTQVGTRASPNLDITGAGVDQAGVDQAWLGLLAFTEVLRVEQLLLGQHHLEPST